MELSGFSVGQANQAAFVGPKERSYLRIFFSK